MASMLAWSAIINKQDSSCGSLLLAFPGARSGLSQVLFPVSSTIPEVIVVAHVENAFRVIDVSGDVDLSGPWSVASGFFLVLHPHGFADPISEARRLCRLGSLGSSSPLKLPGLALRCSTGLSGSSRGSAGAEWPEP